MYIFVICFQCDSPVALHTSKIVPLKRRRSLRNFNQDVSTDDELSAYESDDQFNKVDCRNLLYKNLQHEANLFESKNSCNTTSNPCQLKDLSIETQNYFKDKFFNYKYWFWILMPFIVFILAIFYWEQMKSNRKDNHRMILDLQEKYASQEEDFWISIQVLIEDSKRYNQPKCLMLLYNNETANTIERLLSELSNYALCEITTCSSNSIILEPHEFKGKDITFDYGNIISDNKAKLVQSGVMIIKNLEMISGKSAMAFQSLCDEYQPVVSRALFVFTLETGQYNFEDKSKYVEYMLKKKWNDLSDDLFYPLLTRITNFIFVVQKD